MSFKNNQWVDDRKTVYVVIVSHKTHGPAIVETHSCIKRTRYRINKLERQYATPTNDYKVTFVTSKLQLPQGE